MSPLPLGMIIEGLVAVLLMVTIFYCWILNRRLQRLRADEEVLRATISELMTATEIAERAILGLKSTAIEADHSLGARLKDAERMSAELAAQVGEGEKIFHRISQIAEATRAAAEEREAAQAAAARVSPYGYGQQPAQPQERYLDHGYRQPDPYGRQPQEPAYGQYGAPQGHGHMQPSHGQQQPVAAERKRGGRADDIRSAAAEATARLGRFRNGSGGAAA